MTNHLEMTLLSNVGDHEALLRDAMTIYVWLA
jgi:hypothetical protein